MNRNHNQNEIEMRQRESSVRWTKTGRRWSRFPAHHNRQEGQEGSTNEAKWAPKRVVFYLGENVGKRLQNTWLAWVILIRTVQKIRKRSKFTKKASTTRKRKFKKHKNEHIAIYQQIWEKDWMDWREHVRMKRKIGRKTRAEGRVRSSFWSPKKTAEWSEKSIISMVKWPLR